MRILCFLILLMASALQADPNCVGSLSHSDRATESHLVAESEAEDVFFHQLAREFDINPYRLGAASVNTGYQFNGNTNLNYLFARDYFPFQIKVHSGGESSSVFVTYPSFIHNGHPFLFRASYSRGMAPTNTSQYLSYESSTAKREFWAEVRELPLLIEGGNILVNGDCLLVGRKVLADNMLSEQALLESLSGETRSQEIKAREFLNNVKESGWRTRTKEEITTELSSAFGIEPKKIIYFDGMPLEMTSHVDMFVGSLKEGVVAVPEIPEEVIRQLGYEHEQQASKRINKFLNEQIKSLEKLHLKVIRLPMLSPKNLFESQGQQKGKVLSPVNWLIRGQVIKVPNFPESFEDVSTEVAEEMQAEVVRKLEAQGYQVEFLDAEKLATTRGLLHCISAQYDLSEFAVMEQSY